MTEPNRDSNRADGVPQDPLTGPGGIVLEQYALLEQIGSSRMGAMYKARHRLMGRTVAVKFLSPEAAASPGLTARFHRAIQVLAQLDHPNLVKALEAGETNGAYYLVMEYVDGRDIRAVLKEKGPLPWANAVDYVAQAAAALEYVHCHGVCHRNIKPGNLLLEHNGTIRVTGLTLAHVESGGAAAEAGVADNLTLQGQVIGTYEYMSPEQAADSKNVDARSDVYSLGCTLYALLTGNQPYAGKNLQQVMAHRTAPIPSLCVARPEIPPALDRVFQTMMAKRPEDRYASMKDLIDALGSCSGAAQSPSPSKSPAQAASSTESPSQNLRNVIGGSSTSNVPSAGRSSKKAAKRRSGPPLMAIAGGGALGVLAFIGIVTHFSGASSGPAKSELARSDVKLDGPKETIAQPVSKISGDTLADKASSSLQKPVPASNPEQQASTDKPPVTPIAVPKTSAESETPPAGADVDLPPNPDLKPMALTPQTSSLKPQASPLKPLSIDSRLPPPSDAARRTASRLLLDTYQDDIAKARSDDKKLSLAMTLFEQSEGLKDDPDGRYVLLEGVRTLATAASAPALATRAIDRLARDYKVDDWALKSNLLDALAGNAKMQAQHRAVAQQALAVSQDALRARRFEIAVKASDLAVSEAGKAHELKLAAQGRAAAKESKSALDAYHDYEKALAALKTDPKNGDVNLTAGRYECLVADDWTSGLAKLAVGSDEALRELAAKELAVTQDAQQQVAVADGWWDLAKNESGAARASMLRHAALYYDKALANATGLLKAKIEKRLQSVQP